MADLEQIQSDVSEAKKDIGSIRQALLGYDGQKDLIKQFEEHCDEDALRYKELAGDYYNFKRKCFLIVDTILGTGIVSGSIVGIIQLIW